jgi:hypothetical protein
MQDGRSLPALSSPHGWWLVFALGAASAGGCATGVDVTDGELAEICSEPGTSCDGSRGPGGSAGNTATGGSGTIGSSGNGAFAGSSSGGSIGGTPVGSGGGLGGSINGASGSSGSSTTGGTAGTAGAPAQLADGECLAQSDVVILYRARDSGATTKEPSMVLSVQNNGAAFDLTDLTIRYWFTAETAGNFTFNVDYATFDGQENLGGSTTVTFGQELGTDYAEIGFSLARSVDTAGVREVQLRFHVDGYPDLDQTNDFSFLASATAATPNPNITPYVSGEQVGGCIPAP